MSLIKMPSELETKKTISVLIYGQPGIGKTTLGCSAPDAVLFDYDGGVQRINGAHQVPTLQVKSWEETQQALEEIASELPQTKTIVIDTVGKMIDYMTEFIIRTNQGNKRVVQMDGSLGLGGYGIRKTMFANFVKQLLVKSYNIIFVAHEVEQKRGEEYIKRPEVGGSSVNDLIKELDLVGYMQAIGKKRTITFNPDEHYYAKNTCNLPSVMDIPLILDEQGNSVGDNKFLCSIIDLYDKDQVSKKEQTQKYDELVERLKKEVGNINNATEANMYMERIKTMPDSEHIFNSKMIMRQAFAARMKELGLTYNKETASYE